MNKAQPNQNYLRQPWTNTVWLVLVGSVAVTTAFALLASSFAQPLPMGWPRFLLVTLILSHCIGVLLFGVLPRVLPLTRHWSRAARWGVQIVWVAALAALAVLLTAIILTIAGQLQRAEMSAFFLSVGRSVVPLSAVVSVFIEMVRELRQRLDQTQLRLREKELAEARAHTLAAEARLSALTAQLNPHFLFNTLNSIAALIQDDPSEAEQTVQRLAALLRFTLDSAQQPLVPLALELKIVRDYLAIEQMRFGARLHYDIDIAPALETLAVPPLALQTLVENSVKYAIAPRRAGGWVRIAGARVADALQLTVADDGAGFAESACLPGHGLHNLRARLAVLYGTTATLTVTRPAQQTVVTLTLPWQSVAPDVAAAPALEHSLI